MMQFPRGDRDIIDNDQIAQAIFETFGQKPTNVGADADTIFVEGIDPALEIQVSELLKAWKFVLKPIDDPTRKLIDLLENYITGPQSDPQLRTIFSQWSDMLKAISG